MPPDAREAACLQDMLDAAREARELVSGVTLEAFLQEGMRRRALERTLELVGEAARRVSPEFRANHPEIPWRGIIGTRNVLAHEYGRVNQELIFRAGSEGAPRLVATLEGILGPDSAD